MEDHMSNEFPCHPGINGGGTSLPYHYTQEWPMATREHDLRKAAMAVVLAYHGGDDIHEPIAKLAEELAK